VEEQTGTTLTKYFSLPGLSVTAVNIGGTISNLATDGLSSVSAAVDNNGNALAQQLFALYGGRRYSSGTMPTTKGFTGQRQDATSGLDYYNARYYDAVLGQFISADSDGRGTPDLSHTRLMQHRGGSCCSLSGRGVGRLLLELGERHLDGDGVDRREQVGMLLHPPAIAF
jgi:RHS repeat-associated protein